MSEYHDHVQLPQPEGQVAPTSVSQSGVPKPASLPTVVYSSATPILTGPTMGVLGSATITTLAEFTTETANIWPAVLLAQAKIAPTTTYSPIVLDPAVFDGAPFGVQT